MFMPWMVEAWPCWMVKQFCARQLVNSKLLEKKIAGKEASPQERFTRLTLKKHKAGRYFCENPLVASNRPTKLTK